MLAEQLVGHVDNSAYPLIDVNIAMTVVTPADARRRVPVLMLFSRSKRPAPHQPDQGDVDRVDQALKRMLAASDPELQAIFDQYPGYALVATPPTPTPTFGPPAPAYGVRLGEHPANVTLLQHGWGYALLDPGSVQADNGAGFTRGIVGLTNHGQPRTPDQWGALRAWSWGAARGLDYLEVDPAVDAHHVGIEGVSRYGKA
ncbi:MAG: hypothetical protein ACRYFU_21420, partial [Janthinobacterium lividum]